ncbi:MAG: hypothetical protein GJ680_00595 [Alteromonadaceae bacterium]|nr:hypothetical protein [Alteromonadaceae bacterium]
MKKKFSLRRAGITSKNLAKKLVRPFKTYLVINRDRIEWLAAYPHVLLKLTDQNLLRICKGCKDVKIIRKLLSQARMQFAM